MGRTVRLRYVLLYLIVLSVVVLALFVLFDPAGVYRPAGWIRPLARIG
jgi:hypothetical protein